MVTGLLFADKSITPELLDAAVENMKVYGKIQAKPELLSVMKKKMRNS